MWKLKKIIECTFPNISNCLEIFHSLHVNVIRVKLKWQRMCKDAQSYYKIKCYLLNYNFFPGFFFSSKYWLYIPVQFWYCGLKMCLILLLSHYPRVSLPQSQQTVISPWPTHCYSLLPCTLVCLPALSSPLRWMDDFGAWLLISWRFTDNKLIIWMTWHTSLRTFLKIFFS